LTRNNKIVSYNQLIKEKDSIENLKQVNSIKLQMLDIKLQMAKDVYGINFKETKSEISINSQKIDSALILLENYRKNIFYNNSTSKWEIIENKK
jgi:hypothetical protein